MANFTEFPRLSIRFSSALQFAFEAHRLQIRKQGEVPYISHLLQVSGLVLEAGGNEDEAIAALLHDAVEDAGISIDEISQRFGYDIAYMVGNLTERKETPKDQRKSQYVWFVDESDASVKVISCADKLHNLRSYATDGRHLWKSDTAEFYSQLMPIYEGCNRIPRHWIEEMKLHLAGLEAMSDMVLIPRCDLERLQDLASKGSEWEREFGGQED